MAMGAKDTAYEERARLIRQGLVPGSESLPFHDTRALFAVPRSW